jgi:hypothetical protein
VDIIIQSVSFSTTYDVHPITGPQFGEVIVEIVGLMNYRCGSHAPDSHQNGESVAPLNACGMSISWILHRLELEWQPARGQALNTENLGLRRTAAAGEIAPVAHCVAATLDINALVPGKYLGTRLNWNRTGIIFYLVTEPIHLPFRFVVQNGWLCPDIAVSSWLHMWLISITINW